MKKTNEFRLTLDARSVNEGFARVAVSAFAAPLDPTLEELGGLENRRVRGGDQLHCPRL